MIKKRKTQNARVAAHPESQDRGLGPTAERAKKTMFSRGSPRRVLTTVQALVSSGDVDLSCAEAGERWFRDYCFAFHDYIEYPAIAVRDPTTRHDAVSWHMLRAVTCERVSNVRRALGAGAELRLRLIYEEELSFARMGQILFPHLSQTVARGKTSAQIALVLEQLRDFYQEDKKSTRKVVDNRLQMC